MINKNEKEAPEQNGFRGRWSGGGEEPEEVFKVECGGSKLNWASDFAKIKILKYDFLGFQHEQIKRRKWKTGKVVDDELNFYFNVSLI